MESRRKRKVESDVSKDSNSNKRLKAATNYCLLCQDYGHPQSVNCLICFLCGVKGHARRDCLAFQNEKTSMSTGVRIGDWAESVSPRHEEVIHDTPIISQEDFVLRATKNRETRALTLLGKVDTSQGVEYVRIIPRLEENIKLVTGVHKCIGDQGSIIGVNNVFVTVLIEHGQKTRTVGVGDILGYAKIVGKSQAAIFNSHFTISMKSGMSKLKLRKNVSLQQEETIVIEATVESLPSGNIKNYPLQLESTITYLEVIGDRHTIQKGNSAKVRVRNLSKNPIILKNGDILGNVKSLITEEFIKKIQSSNDDTDQSKEFNSFNSTPLLLDLPYNIVFLEIETLRASNSSAKQITQIGCCSSISEDMEDKFFRVIEPKKLNHYLENFQIAGDLLQFLHLQKNESGQFEYRKQFEIAEEGVEIPKCIGEREALQALALFLGRFWSDYILVSIKKETIELVVERMKHFEIDFSFLKGFCTWDSFLEKHADNELEPTQEFDDWYIDKVNNNVSSCLNTETVARMHKEVINRISETYNSSSTYTKPIHECNSNSIPTARILRSSAPIESLLTFNSAPTSEAANSAASPEFLELSNSFRPNFPTTITMISLETLEISSDEEEALLPISKSKPNVQTPLFSSSQLDHDVEPLQNNVPASTNDMDIWISDDELDLVMPSQDNITQSHETISPPNSAKPDETIPPQSNTNQLSTSASGQAQKTGVYCQVCNKNFSSLEGFHSHASKSGKHKKRFQDLMKKPSVKNEEMLWQYFQKRLSVLSSTSRSHVYHAELEDLSDIAMNFQTKAGLIVECIEKQLPNFPTQNKTRSMRILRFMGALCKKNNAFKEILEKRIVDNFAQESRFVYFRKKRPSEELRFLDLRVFIDLRLEWETSLTFEIKTLQELDLKMVSYYPSWMEYVRSRGVAKKKIYIRDIDY